MSGIHHIDLNEVAIVKSVLKAVLGTCKYDPLTKALALEAIASDLRGEAAKGSIVYEVNQAAKNELE